MAQFLVLNDFQTPGVQLRAGTVIDDALYNLVALQAAGLNLAPFTGPMQTVVDRFVALQSRGPSWTPGAPEADLALMLFQAGLLMTDATHGTLGGGAAHAVAVANAAAGFMSATDKDKLDNLAAVSLNKNAIQTGDANPATLLTFTPAAGSVIVIEGTVEGRKTDGSQGAAYKVMGAARRPAVGNTVLIQTDGPPNGLLFTAEDDDTWGGPSIVVAGNNVDVILRVIGKAATAINWKGQAISRSVS